ncbi:hypothetical protein QQ045_016366 [Rhodiola kirilowii]
MESTASSATPPRTHTSTQPSHPIADRILRAIRHRLLLLHRTGASFFVLGATGNVYTVTLSTAPSCTCPDRTKPCKHILFVLIKALGVPPDASSLRRRTLRPCQLNRLLAAPTMNEALAGAALQDRFHELSKLARRSGSSKVIMVEMGDGSMCPVCLEEMEHGERAESCGTCRNLIHEECLLRWRRSRGRRYVNCVVCRAKWDMAEKDKYLNLAAYATEDGSGSSEDSSNNSRCL